MILLVSFVFGMFYCVYQYRKRKLPPLLGGSMPFIGHSIAIVTAKNYYEFVKNKINLIMDQRVELFCARVGTWIFYGILNPDDAYWVANSCLTKDSIYEFMKPFFGEGLITSGGSTWKIHRKIISPTFNQQLLDGYVDEFSKQSRQFMDTVAIEVGKGSFNHLRYFRELILQIVCATSMGITIDKEDIHTRSMFIEALQVFFDIMTERIAKFWLHSDLIFKLTGNKKRQDMQAEKMNLLSEAILKKKKIQFQEKKKLDTVQKTRFKPFLDHLLDLSEDGRLTDREITDELNTFIGAGTDTMSVAITYALACIGTYRAVQDNIIKELHEVFKGSDRDVEKQDLPRLKYLEAVIKETLRMYPMVPLIGRQLEKDIEIQGYTLPAGSKCYIVLYSILKHWSWGADADTFRPERWLDGSVPANMKGFAAFGLGKRTCIGANFAMMCLKTVLANFLRRFSVKSDVTKMVLEFFITTKPISGHEISIEERHGTPLTSENNFVNKKL